MEYLSNRDLAIIIWLLFIFGLLLYKKNIREVLFPILRAASQPLIVLIIGLLVIYVAGISYILWFFSFWELTLLKATVFWTFGSGLAGLFEYIKKRRVQNFFSEFIRAQFGVIIFVEYVATLKAFSLLFELISLPILTSIAIMQLIAQGKEEHQKVEKLMTWMLSVFGGFLIVSGLYTAWTDIEFWTTATLKDFFLPIILSFAILPFFYLLIVYSTFETRFIGIGYTIKDVNLQKKAKWLAIRNYAFDLEGLDRWFHEIQIAQVQSLSELLKTFKQVRERRIIESNPPKVSLDKGWSPFSAMEFTEEPLLHCKHYKQVCADGSHWYADSDYLKLDGSTLGNMICYRVEGSSGVVTRLSMKLSVQEKSKQKFALKLLSDEFSILLQNAGISYTKKILTQLKSAKDHSFQTNIGEIRISRLDWPDDQAFDLTIDIFHNNHQTLF